ncbi:MAG: DUF4012 domain-containing protein [Patescibacteria group bacterium]
MKKLLQILKEKMSAKTNKNDELGTEQNEQDLVNETAVADNDAEVKKPRFKLSHLIDKTWKKAIIIVLLIILSTVSFLTIYSVMIGQQLLSQAKEAESIGRAGYLAFKEQNLPEAENKFKELDNKLEEITKSYKKLSIYKFVPLMSRYYKDGEAGLHAADKGLNAGLTAIEAITPYADVLGFSGEDSFEGGSAENRVKLILQTLEKVTPQLDAIESDLHEMQSALAEINPEHYPKKIKNKEIKSKLIAAKDSADTAITALTEFRPIIEKLPDIAGATGERRKYLILFQNDNELRPTGGFLTAYAVIFLEDGVVTPEKSDDIYELDKKFNKKIEIPEELGRYLTTEKYWNLRDMNTSPDFKESMHQFISNYKEVRGEPSDIDGVIAVDTHLLTGLMDVVGPIEIPGYGTFSSENDERCDCPQIIYALSEIITRPTPYIREDRKGILGPLMKAILSKIYSSPRIYMANLFTVGLESVSGRHMQAYFFKEDWQTAIEAINAGGRMEMSAEAEDFVAIVDANLAGAKSNLFISNEVLQEISTPENGKITKTVTVTYKNNRKADNCNLEAGLLCLNSTLKDWFRLYVPSGAELTDSQGFTEEVKSYQENGFTVFDGFFSLEPMSQAKVKLSYTLPYSDTENYKVLLWKQGGIGPIKTIMDVNGGQEEISVEEDSFYETKF